MMKKLQELTIICIVIVLMLMACTQSDSSENNLPVLNDPTDTIAATPTLANPTEAIAATSTLASPSAESQTEESSSNISYPIVDTAQGKCYNASAEIPCSQSSFTGQDAQYTGNAPRYQDNGDGTVTDLVTGLMWQQDPGDKMTYAQAVAGASSFNLAGYTDWRLPPSRNCIR